MLYGKLLKALRESRGASFRAMSELMNMNHGNYHRLESGKMAPPPTKKKIDKQLAPFEFTVRQKQCFYDASIQDHALRFKERFWA